MKNLLVVICIFIFCPFVQAQTPLLGQEPNSNIGHYLDRVLERATVASEAASLVLAANEYRQAATDALKAGNKDEARKLFRQAAEVVASALPERDEKQEDPFLREYLTELTSELLKLDNTTKQDAFIPTRLDFSHPLLQ